MGRIRFTVRYDGTEFSGSQIQPGQRTVEGTLKEGLESLMGQPVKLLFASRTDSGVHADGNVAAFDGEPQFPVDRLPELLNRQLSADLAIRNAAAVSSDFHPRFDAKSRTYVYRFFRGTDVPVDRRRYCAEHAGVWDVVAVDDALAGLCGEHEFDQYAQLDDDATKTACTVYRARQLELGSEVWIELTANRFLRHMMCRLAGALILVADGVITASQLLAALDGPMDFRLRPAPAKGLTLARVDY